MSEIEPRHLKITKYEPISGETIAIVPKIGKIYEFFVYKEINTKKQTKYLLLREKEGDNLSYPVPFEDISWEEVKIEENVVS